MALSQSNLKAAIKACLDDVSEGKSTDTAADQLATAIHNYVSAATVLPGTFSNTGGPVVGAGSLS